MKIKFSVSPRLITEVDEVILIYFSEVNAYKNIYGIPIESYTSISFNYHSSSASNEIEATNEGFAYAFIITLLLSLSVSVMTGDSMELMWSCANSLQMIFYISVLNLYYNSDLKELFKFMTYSNYDNPGTKFLSEVIFSKIDFNDSPLNKRFEDSGIMSKNILQNSFDKILMILILILSMMFVYLLKI